MKEGGVVPFRVSLSKAVVGPVTFHYMTADHTATAGATLGDAVALGVIEDD